ncbi:hypothetical protein G7Z17_g12951 [Cylindrodendrum hubeiense]|uniref:Amidase domain-containing protein n=1 Tax=Cylindrodendrum hubeiense TaxID=595255 RepID=A0A9P5L513_9HYPO|nr:hypothetical protein G7Z17_g12951 [Cylindrodendrum hubeiense]
MKPLGSIQETINSDAIIPITLLTTDEVFGDLEGLLQLLDDYDDVFTPDFGSVLVEKPGRGNGSAVDSLEDPSARQVYHLDVIVELSDDFAELPSGPYFLHGPNLHQAWRLYDDDVGAFAFGVIPDDANQPDDSLSLQGNSKSIAVPSRLYHPRPSLRKPLSGIRVSISDFTSLNGTGTALSSRAWASLYTTVSTTTSDYARKLIDLGAIIVGKTKTSQLGTGAEWVDEQAPWSVRGDGYQMLLGSSVGAAAGLAAYEWLQQSIGSDDNGISAQQGLYSIAPSLGSTSFDGIMKNPSYDKKRLFSRSLDDLLHMTTSFGIISPESHFPTTILYPVDLHAAMDESQQHLMAEFVSALEKLIGSKAENVNLGDIWAESRPIEAHGEEMQTYMKDISIATIFRESHSSRQHLNFFDATPNTEAIMILPCGTSDTRHRDDPTTPPTTSEGVTPEYLASILGAPHLAVPFAQLPYESRISERTEYQPVCVSIMGSRGSEVEMIRVVKQAFEKAHWRTQVTTGRYAFPLDKDSQAVNNEHRLLMLQSESLSDEL